MGAAVKRPVCYVPNCNCPDTPTARAREREEHRVVELAAQLLPGIVVESLGVIDTEAEIQTRRAKAAVRIARTIINEAKTKELP